MCENLFLQASSHENPRKKQPKTAKISKNKEILKLIMVSAKTYSKLVQETPQKKLPKNC